MNWVGRTREITCEEIVKDLVADGSAAAAGPDDGHRSGLQQCADRMDRG